MVFKYIHPLISGRKDLPLKIIISVFIIIISVKFLCGFECKHKIFRVRKIDLEELFCEYLPVRVMSSRLCQPAVHVPLEAVSGSEKIQCQV